MSVLIYKDRQTAGIAAATLCAAAVMESPFLTIGVTYDLTLKDTFDALHAMQTNGVLTFENGRIYQLCEYVPSGDGATSIRQLLEDALFQNSGISDENYVVPYASGRNWMQICTAFEDDIFAHGGLELVLVALRPDGSLLYNLPGEELAPVTHVEKVGSDKVVSAGMATLMRAKRIIAVAAGAESAETVSKTLGGSVSDMIPASWLQLHRNVTFVMDEEAASML